MLGESQLGTALDMFGWTAIPKDWSFDLLGNRCVIRRGSSPRPAGDPKFFGDGSIPWIKIGDATKAGGRYIESTDEFVNEEGAKRSVRIPPGSLIIANSGVSLGFAAITRIEGCIHDGWLLTTDFQGIDRDYLYYCINLVTHKIRSFADGTTQPNLNTDIARRLLVPMPPIQEQRAIASLLGALDDKIELNRQINETLEAMARLFFKDWFVDFGPTRAKAEGRPTYLAPDLWALFPDALDDDDKPVGWEISTIGQEVRVVGGSTPSTKELAYWDGDFCWATPKDLSTLKSPVLLNTERRITQTGVSQISSGLLATGTVLLSSRAPIGYLAINQMPTAVNQGFIAMVCEGRLSNVFVWLWTQANIETILQKANGSTFLEISKTNFRPITVIIPDMLIRNAFDEIVQPLYKQIVGNEQESETLAQTRDLLLPELMSGKIRLRDAEKLVEKVA